MEVDEGEVDVHLVGVWVLYAVLAGGVVAVGIGPVGTVEVD